MVSGFIATVGLTIGAVRVDGVGRVDGVRVDKLHMPGVRGDGDHAAPLSILPVGERKLWL